MNLLDFYNYMNFEDVLLLLIFYNFLKIVIVCLFNEIVWLSQFFNKKHNVSFQVNKFRMYYEVVLKLRNNRNFLKIFF